MRPPSTLDLLLEAKARSDRRDYAGKSDIVRSLIRRDPHNWVIDSDDGRGIVGLTYQNGLNFRLHLPRTALPQDVQLQRLPPPLFPKQAGLRPLLEELVDEKGDLLLSLKEACAPLDASVWCHLDESRLWLHPHPGTHVKSSSRVEVDHLRSLPPGLGEEPWAPVKVAYSPTLRAATDLMALTPGPVNAPFGGPRPLTSMLMGGLAGAGAGYLGGVAGEALGGEGMLRKGRLRKTLALLGGLAGATPGALWGSYNVGREGGLQGLLSSHPYEKPALDERFRKAASAFADDGRINVDEFGQVLWSDADPYTPHSLRSMAQGLVDAAGMMTNSPAVTPLDIARIGVGMGTGYASARLVGGTLASLAGLTPQAQQALQRAGTWAGVLRAVVPMAYGAALQ